MYRKCPFQILLGWERMQRGVVGTAILVQVRTELSSTNTTEIISVEGEEMCRLWSILSFDVLPEEAAGLSSF
jgi:hypothetical protein